MDELTIGDKKYISAKRASRLTGYAKDYIGQLCRAEVLEAKKVGRNWYIEEGSLKEHRKTYRGEPVIDPEEFKVEPHQENRPLRDVAGEYISASEVKKKDEALSAAFAVRYEKEDMPLIPLTLKSEVKEVGDKEGSVYTDEYENIVIEPAVEKSGSDGGALKDADVEYATQKRGDTSSTHVLSLRKDAKDTQAEIMANTQKPQIKLNLSNAEGLIEKLLPATVLFAGLLLIAGLLLENSRTYRELEGQSHLVREDLLIGNAISPLRISIPLVKTSLFEIE